MPVRLSEVSRDDIEPDGFEALVEMGPVIGTVLREMSGFLDIARIDDDDVTDPLAVIIFQRSGQFHLGVPLHQVLVELHLHRRAMLVLDLGKRIEQAARDDGDKNQPQRREVGGEGPLFAGFRFG